ncbi:hypothetical protein IFM89_010938 [Coptis chinensis]|uniref:Histone-lysine N-methyltransferase SUVR5 n=1 Tax=Coptis chinensis TaxID=261450 RepID=A0A835IR97_9MAGN|nr:hypothetical protein IFM89_010938 [Coptis chinensis]
MSGISENLVGRNFGMMENPTLLNMEKSFNHQQVHKVDDFVRTADYPLINKPGEDRGGVDESSYKAGIFATTLDPGLRVEEQELPNNHCDSLQDRLNDDKRDVDLFIGSHNFYHNVEAIEGELPNINFAGGSHFPEAEWLEHDESVALWVKWRGIWQAGIRCAGADCPLSTLKARPTHDRKKYFVVFFPHTRNYSWADMLLVRPIHELPEPIAHKTHSQGFEKVKDLTLPRRFIMHRLAVGIVNLIDQLHNEMILQRCVDPGWLQNSFKSWEQRCQNAQSAESVELLKEEFASSVLWNEIEALRDAAMQPELASEWKTWKQEVMKWFSTSQPIAIGRDSEKWYGDDSYGDDSTRLGLQISRKRPKLEVRRAEMHIAQVEVRVSHETQPQIDTAEIDSRFFGSAELENANTLVSEACEDKCSVEGAEISDYPGIMVDKWDGIVVETENNECLQSTVLEETPVDGRNGGKPLEPGNKSRQCSAFIETKGRQCIRWANDGDDYCCVHLAIRDQSPKAELGTPGDVPMCAGTTTHGTKCKHRSQYGSTFCKKHRFQHSQYMMDIEKPSSLTAIATKRSYSEINSCSETASCQELVMVGEVQNHVREVSLSAMEGETSDRKNTVVEKSEHSIKDYDNAELLHCIGSSHQNINDPCPDPAKLHTLYCEKHLPSFLKRARNGKSRIISKEVFIDFLKKCSSQKQKVHVHRACVLLHGFVKSVQSRRNPVSKETQIQWILSEASKDLCVGECLMKLVSCEREKLKSIWNFDVENCNPVSFGVPEPVLQPEAFPRSHSSQMNVQCKICLKEFSHDELLGSHWMDIHKKEAQWLFRGYACAICLNSFTNRKILETHGRERHGVQFLEQCLLLKCIPCGSRFVNTEQLWSHVLSVHSKDFKTCTAAQQNNLSATLASQPLEPGNNDTSLTDASLTSCLIEGGARRFTCKFCGLKFDLLPDLGRHHQAAHMGLNSVSGISTKRGTHLNPYKLKSGRLTRPSFRKGLGAASFRIRNRGNIRMKKHFQASSSAITCFQAASSAIAGGGTMQTQVAEVVGLGRLAESQCSAVAKILFSEIQKAKSRPSNLDILSVARSTCCKISLQAALEEQYGVLPERLYLKAAKLCSELNIQVQWHQDGFICPKGCKRVADHRNLFPLTPLPSVFVEFTPKVSEDPIEVEDLEMDECHYIIEPRHIQSELAQKAIVLCEDLSFGRESVSVKCVVDDDLVSSLRSNLDEDSSRKINVCLMPWDGFSYVTERVLDASLGCDTESSQLGCACPHSTCSAEVCDHVYLFDNDYEDAKDIYGQSMRGKFPYDKEGRIILEEGYLVYECNSLCSCDRSCPNRVLQNGVQVKLEVFKTENKGWAVRALEAISRGTFVCEYIGEVLNNEEASKRNNSCKDEGCSYMYKIDAHIDDMSGPTDGSVSHMIDATRYGNVSRFINHSCSPNLVCYQVLVESMDCQLAHVGLYASRNIAVGEELGFSYREKLLHSGRHPCNCRAPNCEGHLF